MTKRRARGDGSIFQRSDGRFVAEIDLGYVDGRRRRKTVYGRTRAEVAKKLRKVQAQVEAGLPLGDDRLTVEDLLERWLAGVLPGKVQPNTIENYRWAVRSHLVPAIGRKRLTRLTPDDVEALLHAKVSAGMARNSVMRIRSVLVAALTFAERRGLVARNVAKLVDTPPGPKREGRSLTADDAGCLLAAAASDRLGVAFMAELMIGLRPGEVLALQWSEVDLDAAVLHVVRSIRREDGGLRLCDPKTKRSWRSAELPAPLVAAFRQHKRRQAEERLLAGAQWKDTNHVFTTRIGTPVDPRNYRRAFSKVTQGAGLGHWRPNELRHSAISLLSAAGAPLEEIGDLVGHDGTRMTAGVYRHRVHPVVRVAVAPMEALFVRKGQAS